MVSNELNNMRGHYPYHLNYIHGCYIQSPFLELAIQVAYRAGPGLHQAKGIVEPDRSGPDLNRATILLGQPGPISGHLASPT